MQISANGIAIEVEDHGSVNGEPLVLIMGLGMQLVAWHEDFVQQLVSRGFRVIRFENGGPLDLIVSSPDGHPVLARLFDPSGVLVGEGKALDEATAGKTPAPAGLVPHTRLQAEGLEAGDYLLQVVPRDGSKGRQQVPLGFDERP